MRNFKMWLIARKIERNWKKIGRNRQEMAALLDRREPYSSEHLVRLDVQNIRLGDEARMLQEAYLALMQ